MGEIDVPRVFVDHSHMTTYDVAVMPSLASKLITATFVLGPI